MSEEGSVHAGGLGIELLVGTGVDAVRDEDDDYASGAEGTPSRRWRAARVTQIGQDAVNSAARLVGQQVGAVVRQALVGMDGDDLAGATAAAQ